MSATRPGRIMPRWEGAAPLDVVIGVMAFLAALAVGASLVAAHATQSWRTGLTEGITVQILPADRGDSNERTQQETNSVVGVLRATKGIVRVDVLGDADTRALVQPWLGSGALLKELPLPRLVDAAIEPGASIDISALSRRLKTAAPDSLLDDHAHWLSRLKRTAGVVIGFAWAILALIALATAAAVTFATRAGLSAHREIVSLLHQMGARAGFVARTFEWHFCASALAASLIGAALAGALFATAGVLEQAGFEAIPFLPPLDLGLFDLVWLAAVPAAAGLIALATARASVLAVLGRYY